MTDSTIGNQMDELARKVAEVGGLSPSSVVLLGPIMDPIALGKDKEMGVRVALDKSGVITGDYIVVVGTTTGELVAMRTIKEGTVGLIPVPLGTGKRLFAAAIVGTLQESVTGVASLVAGNALVAAKKEAAKGDTSESALMKLANTAAMYAGWAIGITSVGLVSWMGYKIYKVMKED